MTGGGACAQIVEWTPVAILKWCATHFQRHGMASPRLDAELLLAHTLGCKRIDLYLQFDKPLSAAELAVYRKLVQRRAGREPVAYLIGHGGFWTLDLAVGPGCLIPRPETEILVETALQAVAELRESKGRDARLYCLDWGTGSGAIPLALCAELKNLRITAVERSRAAMAFAFENRRTHADLLAPRNNRIDLVRCAGFSAITTAVAPDIIVSNPPYIPSADIDGLEPEVSRAEPREALDGGTDGLDALRTLMEIAAERLVPGGRLILESGAAQQAEIRALLADAPLLEEVDYREDLAGHPRVLHAMRTGPVQER